MALKPDWQTSPFDPPGNGISSPRPPGGGAPPNAPPAPGSAQRPGVGVRGPPGGSAPPTMPPANAPPETKAPRTVSMPPSAGPISGVGSNANGMSPSTPERGPTAPNGMATGGLPQANAPTLVLGVPESLPARDLDWQVPTYEVDAADAEEEHYALESRAESISVLAYGDAVRRGESDYVRTGPAERFTDGVSGEETVQVDGLLRERIGRGSTLAAQKSETTVHGRMSISAVGWKSNWMSGEDSILLGGALTDIWTGGLLIASAMSDDMMIGAGARLTAPVDMWLNQLTGMEERPGTAAADGVMVDLAGTLFEREYGASTHAAAMAVFSGAVYQTQRLGFWPMMRVAVGVRNLLPGAGAAAAEPSPPSPPPAAAVGAEGALVATNMVGGAAGSVRSGDTLPDAMRAADAAEDMGEISNLRHADNTAVQLDDLATAARNVEADVPNGMGAAELPQAAPPPATVVADDVQVQLLEDLQARHAGDLPDNFQTPLTPAQLEQAGLPEGFDVPTAMTRIDDQVFGTQGRAGLIETRNIVLDDIRTVIANKLDEITDAGKQSTTFEDLPSAIGKIGGDEVNAIIPSVPWPGAVAQGDDARRMQLMAEVDALKSLEDAITGGEDPAAAAIRLAEDAAGLYGPADPRTQAYVDMAQWFGSYQDSTKLQRKLAELDLYMLVRAEFLAGRDPRVAVNAILDGADTSPQMRGAAERVLRNLNGPLFDFAGKVPDGMDTAELAAAWRAQADDLRAAAANMDNSTLAGRQRAKALNEAAADLTKASLDVSQGRDPRAQLLQRAKRLEARVFMDGADGAGEASALRAAIAEYAGLLDEFKTGAGAASGLDDGAAPLAVAGVGRLAGDAPIDPSPPYPGLPGEFRAAEDLRLMIEPPPYSPHAVSGVQLDNVRLVLDVEVENVADTIQDGVGASARLDGTGALNDVDTGPPLTPRLDEHGTRWVRAEEGQLAVAGTFERAIIVDESRLAVPDNYEVVRLPENLDARMVAVSGDTQAVIDSAPARTAPADFDWRQTMDRFDKEYMVYRRDSNWRGALAYEDAVADMKADLLRGIADLGGDPEAVRGENTRTMHQALQDMLARATRSDDAAQGQRVSGFLDAHDARFHDLVTDLGQRADEYATTRSLDAHIDAEKLLTWLQAEQERAMLRVGTTTDPAVLAAASNEATYFQQMALAVADGRNPTVESGDQIAYLFGTGRTAQAEEYLGYQQRLVDVMSNADYHKSVQAMGDNTYAPVHFLRPELGEGPSAGLGGPRTEVFDPEPGQLGGGAPMTSGDYARNQEIINARIADGDFATAPAEQPNGILRNAADGGGNVDLGTQRIVNQEPTDYTDEAMHEWIRGDEGTRAQARLDAIRTQGSTADYMDGAAGARPPAQRLEDGAAKNPYVAARTDAANVMWNDTPVRPPKPANSKRKGVRFGNAEVLEVAIDAEDLRLMKEQKAARRGDDAELPWWRGTGVNRATDPLNTDEAVRHVPTPRMAGDKRYRSTWQATRQPGFGRLADAPGTFPVNAREQMITELMQGKRLDVDHIDLLQSGLDNAMEANRVKHREWLKMSTLIRDLRNGGALDGKTLQIMLDIADSAAAAL